MCSARRLSSPSTTHIASVRLVARGTTKAGRHLLVVLDEPTGAGDAYVVTARPMTEGERQEYDGITTGANDAESQD